SLNGTSFSNFASYQVPSTTFGGTWDSAVAKTNYTFAFDLSAALALNDATTVYFRLRNNVSSPPSQTAALFGDLDNVLISATPIPEPNTVLLVFAVGVLCLNRGKRRRPSSHDFD